MRREVIGMELLQHRQKVADDGYTIISSVFSDEAIRAIIDVLERADKQSLSFRQTDDLFAIRQVLQEVPLLNEIIFTPTVTHLIHNLFGPGYFAVRSIYFNKPASSNWFVAYHQDLTISVSSKCEIPGFENWTSKQGQLAVQSPQEILENMFTMRIHLDDTDEGNGALKVIPGSHKNGMRQSVPADKDREGICCVAKGGIMLMKPLLLHASGRTVNNKSRRVVHIEFYNIMLPAPLNWREAISLPSIV